MAETTTDIYTILDNTAGRVLDLLKREGTSLLSSHSVSSPRAVGDAVQEFLASENGLCTCLPKEFLKQFESGFERRSMEDMAFYSVDGKYFAVDCKTHNKQTAFNMPNLISVQRLAKFYENDTNTFCILIVEYSVNGDKLEYTHCHFKPIESFSWDCLTFGALGWGQIQIANANILQFNQPTDRKQWMLELCKRIDVFYQEEISKIGDRRKWFDNIKKHWENK